MTKVSVSSDQSIVSVHVPIAFSRRRGRKLILVPAGSPQPDGSPPPSKADPTLVKALARAHRWKKLLDTKHYATIKEIAETEKVAAILAAGIRRLRLKNQVVNLLDRRRSVRLLVARATVDTNGVRIDLRTDGLATLVADLRPALEARP
ncbi:hypothetical protein WCLP8_550003 [uncultured Gammaproteobacteria bacterium]